MKTPCYYRDHPWFVITDDCREKTDDAASDSREAREPQLHVQVQPVARLKTSSQEQMYTLGTYTAGHIHHRQTHSLLRPTASSCFSLQLDVGGLKSSAQLHCLYRPPHRADWDTLVPSTQPHFSLACRDTPAHIHISPLTLQSLQQLGRTPWCPNS